MKKRIHYFFKITKSIYRFNSKVKKVPNIEISNFSIMYETRIQKFSF